MPKMTHWNSPDPIDVSQDKVAVYVAQGWVAADRRASKPSVTAMTTDAVQEPEAEAPKPAEKAAKRAPAKKTSKK